MLAIEPRQIIEPRKPVGRKMQHSPAGSAATGFGGNRRCHEIRQVDLTENRAAPPPRCGSRRDLRRPGVQSMIGHPAMTHRGAIEAIERSVDLVQQITIGIRVRLFRHPVQRADRRRFIVEQARLTLREAGHEARAPCLLIRRHPERVRHERKLRAGLLVLCDQAQQQPLLERAGEIEIADLRVALLSIAIDPTIALLQPVRIVRQIEMDQVATALLQIEPLSQRVRC